MDERSFTVLCASDEAAAEPLMVSTVITPAPKVCGCLGVSACVPVCMSWRRSGCICCWLYAAIAERYHSAPLSVILGVREDLWYFRLYIRR